MINFKYLDRFVVRFNYLERKFLDVKNGFNFKSTDLYKEYSFLKKIVVCYKLYNEVNKDITLTNSLLLDDDFGIRNLAAEELKMLFEKKIKLELDLRKFLTDKSCSGVNGIFLEIRAATGGDEASIFVEDLLRMYISYFDYKKYIYSYMSFSFGNCGGYKDVILKVNGDFIYDDLCNESGIHRVQRVPKTESRGRVHTSTCTVVVLPEFKVIDSIELNIADLKFDTYRASGAGGQHVNTTDSAVRITHIPTGLVADCQDERSQHKNKQKALSLLMSRVLMAKKADQKKNIDSSRKKIIGSGSRAEKIRTYNYLENRITDHRLNMTFYKFHDIMNGNLDLIIKNFYGG